MKTEEESADAVNEEGVVKRQKLLDPSSPQLAFENPLLPLASYDDDEEEDDDKRDGGGRVVNDGKRGERNGRNYKEEEMDVDENDEDDEESNVGQGKRSRSIEVRRDCPYLDTVNRQEERQRALLQLQWKVMGDNPQEDQELTSKKNYSISSGKRRSKDVSKRTHRPLDTTEVEEKDSPYAQATQTPVSNILKKAENGNNIPKHRKVTHHEYEIETSNGRTITKRKTRSTVMFGQDPRKHRKRDTPKAKTPKASIQGVKGGVKPNPSNIGDLFTEGSLNPYADDPYAFD